MGRRQLLVAALLAVALLSGSLSVVGVPRPLTPTPEVPASSDLLAGLSRSDAANIRAFYGAMADIVVRDGAEATPTVTTTLDLRNRHEYALRMAFANTGMVGKYPGLGQRLDAHLLEAIGSTDLPLTSALREKASRAFLSVK